MSPQDVHELGQLVHQEAPEDPADRSDRWIFSDLEYRTRGFVLRLQLTLLGLTVEYDGTELVHPERALVEAGTFLDEEDRAGTGQLDRERGEGEHWERGYKGRPARNAPRHAARRHPSERNPNARWTSETARLTTVIAERPTGPLEPRSHLCFPRLWCDSRVATGQLAVVLR
jgi:hypothetical protein